jgi:ATP-dependent DNA helicase RecG
VGLVIIDEQHPFGVLPREQLPARGVSPDVLVMTATPISRSFAMALCGDPDVSVMDEIPPGRKPVVTAVRTNGRRDRVYDFIRQECAAGRQAYIVYPLVEASGKPDVAAATAAAARLRCSFHPLHTLRDVTPR